MLYFRTDDENGLSPHERENTDKGVVLNYHDIDAFIAEEVKNQVNGSKNRNIFSLSKSLATVIFKYNYFSDNPIQIITPLYTHARYGGCAKVYLRNKWGEWRSKPRYIPFNTKGDFFKISDRIVDMKRSDCNVLLSNYVLEVSTQRDLHQYLLRHTGVGLKARVSPEKDAEVFIRNIDAGWDSVVISQNVDTVYLIYALQYKTDFLLDLEISNGLIGLLRECISDDIEFNALNKLIYYFNKLWRLEKLISKKIIYEKIFANSKSTDMKIGYDGYWAAYDIMNGKDFRMVWDLCSHYLLNESIECVWKAYYHYQQKMGEAYN